jgi:ubiquinone/menaquinone biosynthesis C-methylase UbiE
MYEELAKGYDELYGEEQLKKLEKIKHLLNGRILDIGAGTGIVARHFKNVVSLDPCKKMLDKCPGKKIIGKAEKLPFKAGEFDTIVSLTAVHHTDIDKVISEIKRLKPKNIVITVLKKSARCKEIVQKLKKEFSMDEMEEEKDIILFVIE